MTTKLESVFHKAGTLSPELQDQLAAQWLAELEDERAWDESFARSADMIDALAEQALKEHAEGKAVEKGWDEI